MAAFDLRRPWPAANEEESSVSSSLWIHARLVVFVLVASTACAGPSSRDPNSPGSTPPASSSSAPHESVSASPPAPDPSAERPRVTMPEAPPSRTSADRAQRLLTEMSLAEQERQAASRHALTQAERLVSELSYAEAADVLRRALLRDPKNEALNRRLAQLQFLLGERSGEIQEFTRELRELAQVRDQQVIAELHQLYEQGVRLLDELKFAEATKTLDRLIARIDSLDSTQPLAFTERVRELREQARQGNAK